MSERKFNVAVVGATGAVGKVFFEILAERKFPINTIHALASDRSLGRTVRFGNRQLDVDDLTQFDFKDIDLAFFSAGAAVSEKFAQRAVDAGAIVIDNTSCFRYEDDVPLVVPEVNSDALAEFHQRRIIANPNCSTIQLVMVLQPLRQAAGLERVTVATYQSVSGAGQSEIDRLARETLELLNGRPLSDQNTPQIAFNVVPHVDRIQDNGYTREEMKLRWESQKILGDPELRLSATAVRVPVFYGHSEAVHIETTEPLAAEEARELLALAPGIEVLDAPDGEGFPTAVTHAAGQDPVFVGRIREDLSTPRGLALWIVADNVRKGAALNAVQIAEVLVKDHV